MPSRQYKFDPRGEEALTVWMRDHLDAGVCAVVHPEVVESELLTIMVPLLNVRECPNPNVTVVQSELDSLKTAQNCNFGTGAS